MIIREIRMRRMEMRMKHPFTTSFGTMQDKPFLLIEAIDEEGNSGWGESVAFSHPWYAEETVETNAHVIRDILVPLLVGKEINHPDEVNGIFAPIRRNNMAKSAVEGAVWDLYAKRNKLTLAEALGGDKEKIDVGISIGIQDSKEQMVGAVRSFIGQGYKRIKMKIKPGADIEVIRAVREAFPDVPLMADANSAYTLEDIELLKMLDDYNLMMVEQPLAHDDIIDHAKLQEELDTPVCLDESIHSLEDARKAVGLGSCRIINVKIGRVGGLTEAKKIHDYCVGKGIDLWCGGMLEAGIGRAHNVALTTLPGFTLPGDTAGSDRYWEEDIITPAVEAIDGEITVPSGYGIGYEPDLEKVNKYTVGEEVFRPEKNGTAR